MLLGVQEPREKHYPEFDDDLIADQAMAFLNHVVGLELLPWQEDILRRSLCTQRGRWSASQVGLIVPRQQGKTLVTEARELVGLFLLGERIFHTAQQAKTAVESWTALTGYIDSVPELRAEYVSKPRNGGQDIDIRLKSGASIRYIARNPNSGRGFRGIDLVVCDEAYALSGPELGSFGPATASSKNARGGAQIWFTSSAGTDASEKLTEVREAGHSGSSSRLLFAEFSLPEGSDPCDRDLWPAAKPSLGSPFCSLDSLEDQFQLLGPREFGREHLGMWNDAALSSIIPFEDWDACEVDKFDVPTFDTSPAVCLDIAPDGQRFSIACAWRWDDGRQHSEVVADGSDLSEVMGWMQRLIASSNPPRVCALQAGGQTSSFGPELEQVGFKVKYFTPAEVIGATAQFEQDILARKFTHIFDPKLKAALGGASKYLGSNPDLSGGWRWIRRSPAEDITSIVAASYANRALTLELVEESLNAPVKGSMFVPAKYRRA